jgi:hypothetical protein
VFFSRCEQLIHYQGALRGRLQAEYNDESPTPTTSTSQASHGAGPPSDDAFRPPPGADPELVAEMTAALG